MREDYKSFVNAIAVSDLHLSHRPPTARCTEEDWYVAQARPLAQLYELQAEYRVPLLIAGDIFDDGWRPFKCPPQLINFALKWIRNAYGVPGQHDLPYHRYADIRHSAYWTLVAAKALTNLEPGEPVEITGASPMRVMGFPWGAEPARVQPHGLFLEVALVHHYCWRTGRSYPGAAEEDKASNLARRLRGYDVAFFGDNHVPFKRLPVGRGEPLIWNCGGFQRRRRDELGHRPRAALLFSDGTVQAHYLDCTADVFADADDTAQALAAGVLDVTEFVREMNSLGDAALDFVEALRAALKQRGVRPGVRRTVLQALDAGGSHGS